MEVVGYTYDADHWCEDCLLEEGVDLDDDEVGAIFDYTESDYPMHCNACGEFLGGNLTDHGLKALKEAYRDGEYRNANGDPSEHFQQYMEAWDSVDWHILWSFLGPLDPWGELKD